MSKVRMFLDDVRDPPPTLQNEAGWVVCRTMRQAQEFCEIHRCPDYISFDHDLAEFWSADYEANGYEFAKWLVEKDMDSERTFIPEGFRFVVHSMNPVGSLNIQNYLQNYLRQR